MRVSPRNTTVGFIGTGVMGSAMARHILNHGYRLHVHSRTPARATPLCEAGARWEPSVARLAEKSDVILTMVGFPSDVEAVYQGPGGILETARPGTLAIDMTTSRPDLAITLFNGGAQRDIHCLDAPVTGGDVGARNASLSIMVGGAAEDFNQVRPLLEQMGTNIHHQGPAGSGQHAKMVNQIAIAATMVAMCEALAYAEKAGLDPETVLASISQGAAGSWSLSNLAPRIIKGDYQPGFYVKHFIKDMSIALASAEAMGLETPGLALAADLYNRLAREGCENEGTQALYKIIGKG